MLRQKKKGKTERGGKRGGGKRKGRRGKGWKKGETEEKRERKVVQTISYSHILLSLEIEYMYRMCRMSLESMDMLSH